MRLQNQFKSGIDIAKYTASLMRKDMDAYDSDTSAYTQSLVAGMVLLDSKNLYQLKNILALLIKNIFTFLAGWLQP